MKGLQSKRGGRATGSVAKKAGNLMFLVLMIVALSAMFAMPAVADDYQDQCEVNKVKASIKKAEGSRTTIKAYDWEIEKIAVPDSVIINKGDSATIEYTINVTRNETIKEKAVVNGEIEVDRKGAKGVKVILMVKYLSGDSCDGMAGPSTTIEIPDDAKGKNKYGYTICFDYQPDADHVVVIDKIIADGEDCEKVIECESKNIRFDESVNEIICNDKATVTDVITCPSGFSCDRDMVDEWEFTGSGSISYKVKVTNDDVSCGEELDLVNTATLISSSSQVREESLDDDCFECEKIERTASKTVKIFTESCPPEVPTPTAEVTPTAEKPAPKPAAKKELPFTGMYDLGFLGAIALAATGGSMFAATCSKRGRRFLTSSDVTADEVDGEDTN